MAAMKGLLWAESMGAKMVVMWAGLKVTRKADWMDYLRAVKWGIPWVVLMVLKWAVGRVVNLEEHLAV